jgi:hypothetical protein
VAVFAGVPRWIARLPRFPPVGGQGRG